MLLKSQMKCYSLEVVGPFWNFGPVESVSKMSLLCPNQKKQFVGRTSLVLFVVPTNRPHNREKPYPAAAFLPTHPPPDVCSHGTANADCSCSEGNIAPGPLPPPTLAWLSSCTCLNIVGESSRGEESASYLRSIW